MQDVTVVNARVLTLAGAPAPRRGNALGELGVIEPGWVSVTRGRIGAVGGGSPPAETGSRRAIVNAYGRVLMPAFVDCHTHACWAGNRFDEFQQRLAGRSYPEILAAGGGILSTVRAVREAVEDELAAGLRLRLERMAALGTGSVEVKSGYGLTTADELKMLRAIHSAAVASPQHILATFLGAHALDPGDPALVDRTIDETLPAVADEFPGIPCDAYCEQGAWSLADVRRLFRAASGLGLPLRVHADQFHSLGAVPMAVEMGALSVDHLEATTPQDLEILAGSDTMGVVLPACGFHLDGRFAPARRFVDAGGALALATNYNPGSAPTPSIPFVIALAARHLELSPAEAIAAATINAACVLRLEKETGSIEAGKRADLQLLDCRDERELACELATAGPQWMMIDGKLVHRRAPPPDEVIGSPAMVVTAERDIEGARTAAQCVVEVHRRLAESLAPGQTLAQIDRFVAEALSDLECRSAFLRYRMRGHPPYPSHACLSLNDCIVHGTHDMTDRPLRGGDILSVDIGAVRDGWIGDAAWTYAIAEASEEALRLMHCGRETLRRGIAALRPGRPLMDWARAVQACAETEYGFHLVRGLGGHGYGRTLHGAPFISNVVPRRPGEWPDSFVTMKPGMLLAVEPMVAAGTPDIINDGHAWPIFTADGSIAVHYEADVIITDTGHDNLTAGLDELPDVVG